MNSSVNCKIREDKILTTWDHRERRRDCRLSALSCDDMSRTGPTLLSAPWGQWCVLVIATFSPDSSSFQFSSTFWKFFLSLLIKVSVSWLSLKTLSLTLCALVFFNFSFTSFLFTWFCVNVCGNLTLQQTFFQPLNSTTLFRATQNCWRKAISALFLLFD